MKIETTLHPIKLDPPAQVFAVVVSTATGEWRETFATQAERDAFARGVRAGVSLSGSGGPLAEGWMDERPITLGKEMA